MIGGAPLKLRATFKFQKWKCNFFEKSPHAQACAGPSVHAYKYYHHSVLNWMRWGNRTWYMYSVVEYYHSTRRTSTTHRYIGIFIKIQIFLYLYVYLFLKMSKVKLININECQMDVHRKALIDILSIHQFDIHSLTLNRYSLVKQWSTVIWHSSLISIWC